MCFRPTGSYDRPDRARLPAPVVVHRGDSAGVGRHQPLVLLVADAVVAAEELHVEAVHPPPDPGEDVVGVVGAEPREPVREEELEAAVHEGEDGERRVGGRRLVRRHRPVEPGEGGVLLVLGRDAHLVVLGLGEVVVLRAGADVGLRHRLHPPVEGQPHHLVHEPALRPRLEPVEHAVAVLGPPARPRHHEAGDAVAGEAALRVGGHPLALGRGGLAGGEPAHVAAAVLAEEVGPRRVEVGQPERLVPGGAVPAADAPFVALRGVPGALYRVVARERRPGEGVVGLGAAVAPVERRLALEDDGDVLLEDRLVLVDEHVVVGAAADALGALGAAGGAERDRREGGRGRRAA